MKLPKFMIAENPMASKRVFILHSRSPRFIAEAFHFELDQEKDWLKVKQMFDHGASVDYPGELIAVGVHWMEPNELDSSRLAKLMSRMGDWYHAYLKFEDSQ